MGIHRLTTIIAGVITLLGSSCSREPDRNPGSSRGLTYVTRRTLEPDKLASIWLIKRHVDKEAKFEFVNDDTPLTNGIPFDTPEAELRRYANLSCYESILKKHTIQDAGVQRMGELIHDIEINYWGQKRFAESEVLNRELREIIQDNPASLEMSLEKSFAVFDRLLHHIHTNVAISTATSR